MPIRLNLMAETLAAEDMRRRDPVKRAVFVGLLLIVLILVWSSSLQLKSMLRKNTVAHLQGEMQSRTNEFQQFQSARARTQDAHKRIAALKQLAGCRLLNGTLLDSLQQSMVPDIQLTRFRVDQGYTVTEPAKGKPGSATEHIVLTIEGLDSSTSGQGEQVSRFKESIATNPYFKENLARTNGVSLKNLLPAQLSPVTGKSSIPFTLECRYPDITR
jgi:hypothetical protein